MADRSGQERIIGNGRLIKKSMAEYEEEAEEEPISLLQ